MLSTASELANSRASKIIGVRNEQHAALQLGQFLEMFSEAWTFVIACEVICRKMIVGLRGTMVVQVRSQLFLVTNLATSTDWSTLLLTDPGQDFLAELSLSACVEFGSSGRERAVGTRRDDARPATCG